MICLDTSAVIAILNENPLARLRFEEERLRGEEIAISSVVLFELWFGAAKSRRRDVSRTLIEGFVAGPTSVLPFHAEDATEAGEIRAGLERAGTPIGPYDVLLAAQARRRDALLVTANRREFARVPGLRIEDWSQ